MPMEKEKEKEKKHSDFGLLEVVKKIGLSTCVVFFFRFCRRGGSLEGEEGGRGVVPLPHLRRGIDKPCAFQCWKRSRGVLSLCSYIAINTQNPPKKCWGF